MRGPGSLRTRSGWRGRQRASRGGSCRRRGAGLRRRGCASRNRPRGGETLEGLLLASDAPGADPAAAAARLVAQSERRWVLEEFCRAIQSGARLEAQPWRDAGSLKKCLAFDAITA